MVDNNSVKSEENILKVKVVYGKENLKDIVNGLLESMFIREINQKNG